jgi:hypothetical protein
VGRWEPKRKFQFKTVVDLRGNNVIGGQSMQPHQWLGMRQRVRVWLTFSIPVFLLAVFLSYLVTAQEQKRVSGEPVTPDQSQFPKPSYSPYADRNYPTQVFWGDEHLHTSWSGDAGASGTTIGPEDALRFARGEQVVSNTGQPVKLSRPLDWIAITDHSDGMGILAELKSGNAKLMQDPVARRWHDMITEGGEMAQKATMEMISAQANKQLPASFADPTLAQTVWEKSTAIMEKYNEPGRFTAFIGYEWTSNVGGGDNLHRNVIYRDGKARADQMTPFNTFESENPEDLWKWMQRYEEKTGGSLLAIPHNGNLSNGRMFQLSTFAGNPMTREYAFERQRWEPLFEAWQVKGQSEVHPSLSPTDEFANWEIWDKGNLTLAPKESGMLQYEYLRQALKNGLMMEEKLGANPFKYGMASGTDSHTGLATAEQNNFFGKFPSSEPSAKRATEKAMSFGDRYISGWELAAAGYMGVWATQNTREALWDAMKRKETYASSGPRMVVRFFGGWDFVPADAHSRIPAAVGYKKGVPMGGDLKTAPSGRAPVFLVAAMKDPYSGNLDRIQIVKGWIDKKGQPQEKIYNIVWSDPEKRKMDSNGKIPAVGNTVDVANASWTNTIGAPELITVWRDPDFDPSRRAFYYARVLEIPTPRWTAYDAKFYHLSLPNEVPMTTQERAITSPIWYTP